MPINATLNPTKDKTPALPALFISKNRLIVLFTAPTEGTVVFAGISDWKIGDYNRHFIECTSDNWEPYMGIVTLRNE